MPIYETPTDWKSVNWWRNREFEERKFHAKVPPRLNHDYYLMDHKFITEYKPGDSLLITGPSGCGKTYMAVQLLNSLLASGKISGRFVDADDYIEMIKDSFSNDGDMPEMYSSPHLLKYIKGVWDVVVLDSLGNERQTDFAKHEMGTLLRHRHDHNRTTIVTSTYNLTDLRNKYGDRVSTPLIDMKQVTLRARQ